MPQRALLLLGGNVGDRLARLRGAVRALNALPGSKITAKSRVYETAPVGPSDRPYLNAAVALDTELTPMGLLVECKRLETAAGRRPAGKWAARPLDIDILVYGKRTVRTPFLTIPHPLMQQRPFVLAPLSDIAPDYRLRGGRDAASALRHYAPSLRLVKIYPHGL
jgi:2-amino-4-hydroxy-6-hydroxymethyldihydropteridine diphosphokinase